MTVVNASKAVLIMGLLVGCLQSAAPSFAETAPGLTRIDSGGRVTIKVTYIHPQDANELRFAVVLDTHSVNLDGYDLKGLTLLRDETGKNYEPTKVENKGSGHHREVALIFPRLSPDAKQIEIIIKDIAGVKERTFRWDLK